MSSSWNSLSENYFQLIFVQNEWRKISSEDFDKYHSSIRNLKKKMRNFKMSCKMQNFRCNASPQSWHDFYYANATTYCPLRDISYRVIVCPRNSKICENLEQSMGPHYTRTCMFIEKTALFEKPWK